MGIEHEHTEGSAPTRQGKPIVRSGWLRYIQPVLLILALVYPICWVLGRYFWLADLICHFQEPFLAITFLALGTSLLERKRLVPVALILLAAMEIFAISRYLAPNPVAVDPVSKDRFRILLSNVLLTNPDYDALIKLIRSERPDVFGLVEYTTTCQEALHVLKSEYPYSVQAPARFGAEGLSLWFREPPIAIDSPESLTPGSWLAVHATFSFSGKSRHIWLVHPRSPLSSDPSGSNKGDLEALAEQVRRTKGSRVVIGDMNSTDGSAHFRDFLSRAALRDSRFGFGRQPSWPVGFFYRIAIDHLFLTNDLAVVERRLGTSVNSDHYPLIVDLAPASPQISDASNFSQPSKSDAH